MIVPRKKKVVVTFGQPSKIEDPIAPKVKTEVIKSPIDDSDNIWKAVEAMCKGQ